MLNNKGQSLILFVLVLPILLLILVLVIDIGRVIVRKQELDNINKIALNYGLDKINEFNLEDIVLDTVNLNDNNIDDIYFLLEDDKIYLNLYDNVDTYLANIIKISLFKVESSYVGYIDNNKKRIERVVGD